MLALLLGLLWILSDPKYVQMFHFFIILHYQKRKYNEIFF